MNSVEGDSENGTCEKVLLLQRSNMPMSEHVISIKANSESVRVMSAQKVKTTVLLQPVGKSTYRIRRKWTEARRGLGWYMMIF